jgi:hypothetical protein
VVELVARPLTATILVLTLAAFVGPSLVEMARRRQA